MPAPSRHRLPGPALGAALLLAGLVLATPVAAAERSGTTEIDLDGRTIVHRFSASDDPATGLFRRSGTVEAGPGLTISYTLSGTCQPERTRCDLAGTGTGPRGRSWSGQGTLVRSGGTSVLRVILTGPDSRTITVTRTVDGPDGPGLLP